MLEVNWNVGGNKVSYTFDRDKKAPSISQYLYGEGTALRKNTLNLGVLDGLDGAPVGICFDSGHVNIVFRGGKVRPSPSREPSLRPAEYARAVAGRIISVHFHDNYGNQGAGFYIKRFKRERRKIKFIPRQGSAFSILGHVVQSL